MHNDREIKSELERRKKQNKNWEHFLFIRINSTLHSSSLYTIINEAWSSALELNETDGYTSAQQHCVSDPEPPLHPPAKNLDLKIRLKYLQCACFFFLPRTWQASEGNRNNVSWRYCQNKYAETVRPEAETKSCSCRRKPFRSMRTFGRKSKREAQHYIMSLCGTIVSISLIPAAGCISWDADAHLDADKSLVSLVVCYIWAWPGEWEWQNVQIKNTLIVFQNHLCYVFRFGVD